MADDFVDANPTFATTGFIPETPRAASRMVASNPDFRGTMYLPSESRAQTRIVKASVGGGGAPAPASIVYYLNVGWCTDHRTNETWVTSGSPGPVPGDGTTHHILVGSQSYTIKS